MSKQNLLLKHLQAGKAFTAKQISASFGLKNPHEAVRSLREQGYCIYSNETKLSTGKVATKYRIGKPSKRMLVLAYKVAGNGIFARG